QTVVEHGERGGLFGRERDSGALDVGTGHRLACGGSATIVVRIGDNRRNAYPPELFLPGPAHDADRQQLRFPAPVGYVETQMLRPYDDDRQVGVDSAPHGAAFVRYRPVDVLAAELGVGADLA